MKDFKNISLNICLSIFYPSENISIFDIIFLYLFENIFFICQKLFVWPGSSGGIVCQAGIPGEVKVSAS